MKHFCSQDLKRYDFAEMKYTATRYFVQRYITFTYKELHYFTKTVKITKGLQ